MRNLLNFIKFILTNKNSFEAYLTMRKSYIVDHDGIYFKIICFLNSIVRKKYNIKESVGVLGQINQAECNKIVNQLKSDGFYVFENKLNLDSVEKLYNFASITPINLLSIKADGGVGYSENKEKYIESKSKSNRHQFNDIVTLFNSEIAKELFFDKNFIHIANEYLNCKPWIDIFTMWWSNPVDNISEDYKNRFKLSNNSRSE